MLGHFHETADENSSRLLCSLERVRAVAVRVLFLSELRSAPRPLAFSPRGLVDGGRDASIVSASKRRKIVTAIQHDRSTQEATPDAAHRAWKSKGARWKAIGATEMSSSESRGREKEHCYRRLSRGIDWVRDEVRDSAVASVSSCLRLIIETENPR